MRERTDSGLIEDGLPGGQGSRMLRVQLALVWGDAAVEGLAVGVLGRIGCAAALSLGHSL